VRSWQVPQERSINTPSLGRKNVTGGLRELSKLYVCYTTFMSSLLEQVVEDLRSLSREEQDRAAKVLLAFLDGSQDDFRLIA
jgi:hypothetical protein